MKFQLLLVSAIALLFIQCKSKKNIDSVKVSIELTTSSDYCGGAAPSDEMLKDLSSKKVFVNNKFYLVLKDDAGIIISETEHTTDKNGKLNLKVKKGMYEMFLLSPEQRKQNIENMDEKFRSCSTIFYEQPQAHLHAWQNGIQKIDMHIKCNPCLPPAP